MQTGTPPIAGSYQTSMREYLGHVPALNRGTRFSIGFGVLALLLAFLSLPYLVPVAIELALAIALLSGYYAVPFTWLTLRSRREQVAQPVEVFADRCGPPLHSWGHRGRRAMGGDHAVARGPGLVLRDGALLKGLHPARARVRPIRARGLSTAGRFQDQARTGLTGGSRIGGGRVPRARLTFRPGAVQSAGAGSSGTCGDAWFRQGPVTGEREPRCRQASLNRRQTK